MSFINKQPLSESNRTLDPKKEKIGFILLILALLLMFSNEYWLPYIAQYLKNTSMPANFKHFLYTSANFIHFLFMFLGMYFVFKSRQTPIKLSSSEVKND